MSLLEKLKQLNNQGILTYEEYSKLENLLTIINEMNVLDTNIITETANRPEPKVIIPGEPSLEYPEETNERTL